MTSRKRQITLGTVISYFSIVFNIVAGLLYTPWMVRQIGQSQYGLYTLASSSITLFLVDFGLSAATARYISRYHAQGDEEGINRFLGTISQLYLILDAVIFLILIVLYFFTDSLYKTLTAEELRQFKVVYIIAASFSVVNFPFVTLNGILTAHELFIQQKAADLIHRALTILLVVIALLNGMGLYALVTANAVSGLTTTLFKLIMIRWHTKVRIKLHGFDVPLLRELFGFSAWITVASLAQRLIFNITPSILGMVASSASIAVFGIVTTIEGYTFTITNAINGMFMPKISRIVVGHDQESSLQPLLLRVGKFQYALNGLIIAGFAVIGREFILLWMGEHFVDAYWGILLVLIPGLFYNALQIAHTTVVVQNLVKISALVNVGAGVINVMLSFFLSSRFGVLGASTSIFFAYMFRAVMLMAIYHKKLDMDILEFCRSCYLRLAPIILGTIALGFFGKSFVAANNWICLAANGAFICAVYFLLLFFLGFDQTEKARINRMLHKGL